MTSNVNEKAFVYRNNAETKSSNKFQKVKLESPKYALLAGTKVDLYSDSLFQTQTFMPVRGFQSAQWDLLHFGMGNDQHIDSLIVTWADGSRQKLLKPKAGKLITVKYSDAKKGYIATPPASPMWQPTSLIDFKHREDSRNDFRIQTLLPSMLSFQGPHFAQKDLNGDGTDDFYIGGGRGQAGALFISSNGKFQKSAQPAFEQDAAFEDADMEFFDADGDGDYDLMVTSEGYELNANDPLMLPRLYINDRGGWKKTVLPVVAINSAALAIADVDKDGDLDAFLGSRVTPARFPESEGGVVLLNDGKGKFTQDMAAQLKDTGMVTDASFQDLNKDGYPELVLTDDWNSIQVFNNNKGKLTNASESWGTAALNGCWNAIKAADLDGDGDTDFIVGNMGQNWQWNLTSPSGLSLYAGDFDKLGRVVPLISVTENGKEYPYASRDELLDQIPSLKKKYTNYVLYSKASLDEMLPPEKLKAAKKLTAKEFRTGVLENKAGKLVFHPLPIEAQFAPVYAISVLDVNADGKPDIILGGNQKQTRVRIGKNDANLLQVFLNKGPMKFGYLPQAQSGFYVNGDVRDLAVFKMSGETFLLGAVNNASVVCYKMK